MAGFLWPLLYNGLAPKFANSFTSCLIAAGHPDPSLYILLGILSCLSFLLYYLASSQGYSGSPQSGIKPNLCVLLVALVINGRLLPSLTPAHKAPM